ncbi:hypothetical protein E4U61_004415 [Claviceps capensis]|nr:hypothetical protein E4U61_004415 [Claviceps capensis]
MSSNNSGFSTIAAFALPRANVNLRCQLRPPLNAMRTGNAKSSLRRANTAESARPKKWHDALQQVVQALQSREVRDALAIFQWIRQHEDAETIMEHLHANDVLLGSRAVGRISFEADQRLILGASTIYAIAAAGS